MLTDCSRTEHVLLCAGLVILALPYLLFLTGGSEEHEKPSLVSRRQPVAIPPQVRQEPPPPPPTLSHVGFADFKWSKLTWRPLTNSPCVATYQWTSNKSNLQCPFDDPNHRGSCGGIAMSGCSSFVSGEFIAALPSDPKPSKLWNSRNANLPLCSNDFSAINGSYLLSTNTFNDSNIWAPFNCSLAPLDLESLARVSAGVGPVIFIGDSHGRNSFSAFVAGLRQKAYFVETHDDQFKGQQGMLVYRIHRVAGKLEDHRGLVLLANHSPATLHDELDCDAKSNLCLQVLFFWAPHFSEQNALFPMIKALHPSLLVLSPGNSYEKEEPFPSIYSSNLTALLRALPHLSLAFNIWPWANMISNERAVAIRAWREDFNNKIGVLNHQTFGSYGGVQGARTWHYACSGRHDDAGLLHGIEAFENCSDVVDTSMVRMALTFALVDEPT